MQRWALNSFFSCPNGMKWNKTGRSRGGIKTSNSNQRTKLSLVPTQSRSFTLSRTAYGEQYAVCVIHILFSFTIGIPRWSVSVWKIYEKLFDVSLYVCAVSLCDSLWKSSFCSMPSVFVCIHARLLSISWRLILILQISNEMHFVYLSSHSPLFNLFNRKRLFIIHAQNLFSRSYFFSSSSSWSCCIFILILLWLYFFWRIIHFKCEKWL